MVVPTNVRVGRIAALLVGVQTAKGTPVSDFTSGANGRAWSDAYGDDLGPLKSNAGGWMTQPLLETDARYGVGKLAQGSLTAKATPQSLGWFLRSNWGSYSGGVWTLLGQVNEWLSFGWVENVLTGATQYFHRISDAWLHSLTLRATPYDPLTIEAEYAAEVVGTPVALNALGGITLPAAPMNPDDVNVFPGRMVKLFRDPTGANVEIALHSFAITFDQGLGSMWDMAGGKWRVYKVGHPGPRVLVEFTAHVSDETWGILTQSRAGTKERYRITAAAEDPTQTLTIDLYQMDFEFDLVGHAGQRFVQFSAIGQAHRDSDGNFVTIALT